jgi:hypothetical protein
MNEYHSNLNGKYKPSKYIGVNSYEKKGVNIWISKVNIKGVVQQKSGHTTEREAAKWVDLQLIRKGQDPVNILKRIK